ncbi:MAG TPA: CHAT domain-containing protein [Saprospiraceae bacterium]|nr:CHAT domain-containing protein [Saprospiraceae bacterium]HMQ83132.1 CHAT domain-containing protein [Saprospiraceae bacterium]
MRCIIIVALLAAIAMLLARKQAFLNQTSSSSPEEAYLKNFSTSTVLPEESHFRLLDKLAELAQYHRHAYYANQQVLELHRADQRFQQAIDLLEGIAQKAATPLIRERLQKTHSSLFEAAVANAYELYQLTDSLHYIDVAWFYTEKSKTVFQKYALPKKVTGKKVKATFCRPQAIKKITSTTLDADQTLVQYFFAGTYLYVFAFSENNADLWRFSYDEKLEEAVKKVRESIAAWAQSRTDLQLLAYTQNAHWLYEQLLAPIASRLNKRLIIIPDGCLEHLPFDALLYDSVNIDQQSFKDYPYLIQRHAISYASSLTLLRDLRRHKKRAAIPQILAFAPSYTENEQNGAGASGSNIRGSQTALLNNTNEIQLIASLMPSQTLIGASATKERFLKEMDQYQIIHLAMHAQFDEQNAEMSHLHFTHVAEHPAQNLLYAKELYDMELNADLVVLSACETGMGEMKKGEGLVSLKNGFMYAGAKSQIATLWQVSDLETAQIMQLFYKGLVRKESKDAAMQLAKLDYLKSTEPALAHPFYWAAFTASGDVTALDFSSETRPLWWTLLIFGLVAQILYIIARILGFIKHKETRFKGAIG